MTEPHDPPHTVDVPSVPANSLDAGLAAGFSRPAEAPRSSLDASQRPVLLREAKGESNHVVKPHSDAMPAKSETGDRYQLFGEIARGGMGAVLRGRDVDLGRDLAVKILLEKHAQRPDMARRFLEEAQIGGQLQHPGVVPVYDVGRFGERPFFTMKLVKGHTLAALLSKRGDPSEDRPRLLSIALQVTQALAYVHAKGVIHRDLKPANVMVGAFGEVQVMDWGLAKVLAEGGVADEERASRQNQPEEGTRIRTARSSGPAGSQGTETEAGSLLGTPAYMPPEQANGEVALLDRRADVFGLGAILCEILTGKPPYVGRSVEEVRRKSANGDLADATARLDGCGADQELVALTKTCLCPEAVDRPKDAREVADGLQGYLDSVQERLRQAELAEAEARAKAVEEAKRRRLTLALAATVLLALTLGGGSWLWLRNERDVRQARVAREVNDAVNRATALRERAKAAAVGGATLFAQAREQTQRALALAENGPADETLTELVRNLQAELDEEEKDPTLLTALDEARLAQAETVAGENRFANERAAPLFREALRAYGLPAGEGDPAAVAARIRQRPARVREGLLAALDEWSDLAADPGLAITEPHLAWLRAVVVAAEPEDGWTRRLRSASAEQDARKRRAALEKLAEEADRRKLPARSLTQLARGLQSVRAEASAVRMLRRAQQHYPADFWVNHNLGVALESVTPPQWEEAVRYLTAAVALRPDSSGTHYNLGKALKARGQVDEAVACFHKAIALAPKYAAAHCNLGNALAGKGQVDEAVACYHKAIALDPKNAAAHCNLGNALAGKGQVEEAVACYHKAIAIDPKYAGAHNNLGNALKAKGQVDEAAACFHKAIALAPMYAAAHSNLGVVLQDKGQVDEAVAWHRKAIELDPKYAQAHYNLGNALEGKGQVDEAVACYHKAIAIDPKYAQAHNNLGKAMSGKGKVDEAIACYHKAIALDPQLARAHLNLGLALKAKGQVDEAVAWYRKAIELDPKYAQAHYSLGNALRAKGQAVEAVACFRKAIELDPKYTEAHCNLGHVLQSQGRFAEALAALSRGHELGSKRRDWRYPSAAWVRQCQRLLELDSKLAAVLAGKEKPKSPAEACAFAHLCAQPFQKRYAAAARLFEGAFAADAKLAAGRRYDAACSAALAAAGQGEDAAKLDAKERMRLRKQALDWLRAELALRSKQLASGLPADRAAVQQTMRHWQKDGDLAGIRDKAALDKLPAEEQKGFAQLWADVAALLKKAEEKPK